MEKRINPGNIIPVMLVLCLAMISCSPTNSETAKETTNRPDNVKKNPLFVKVDTAREKEGELFYQFVQATDSTAHIKWGNKEFTNISKTAVPSVYLDKDKVNCRWANEKYLDLARGTGSDTWIDIILPLKKDEDLRLYYNALAFEKTKGLVVYEYPGDDSILVAENIMSKKKQIVGKGWTKCSSAIYHYCIDSISIKNNTLYVEWVLPNRIDEPNKKEIKVVKLDL